MIAHEALAREFERWRRENEAGGWACRWRRRPVWLAQIVQRLGWNRAVRVPLFFGERMTVVTGEEMSTAILAFGYTEAALTALMLRFVRPGTTFVDVGTHFGYEAMLAARLVGPRGRVIAFEPNPHAREIASRNLGETPGVTLFPVAVGASSGVLSFEQRSIIDSAFARRASAASDGSTVTVPLTTLDRALEGEPRVGFLKCDVEGAEEDVLAGAQGLLRRDAPLLVLEADMPGPNGEPSERAHRFARLLAPLGYAAFSFDYDGTFKAGPLGSIPVGHANVAFAAGDDTERLRALHGT